ncbi:cardiolipin synthase A, partial [Mycobacterium tuberculosis]|nr:cardiolipin synthase A [Mycobacterium tuberculosis]
NYGSPRNTRLGREWVDLMMEVRGEIVQAMNGVFAVDWYSESGEVIETFEELSRGTSVGAGGAGGDPTAGDPVSAFQLVPSGPGYRT